MVKSCALSRWSCSPANEKNTALVKRILILGVNGFIGHHLSKRVLAGTDWEVYGMDMQAVRLTDVMGERRFKFFEGDITINKEWIEYHIRKCDVILPLVAIATPATYVREPLRVFELDFEANLPIVRSCVKHGKRLILFMRGPVQQEDSNRREVGYRAALAANGIQVDEKLILNGEFERDIAYQSLNDFLGNGNKLPFDAVFTGDDDAAIGVLRALHDHGYRIPEDVAVAGFDDLGFAQFLNPPLTTVRAPTEAVGRMAAERLFEILENQASDGTVVLPTEIIFRRSCGCQV